MLKFLSSMLAALFGIFTLAVVVLGGAYLYLTPELPSVQSLKDVRMQEPLRVYTQDGKLIAQFGEIRRIPVTLAQVPKPLIQAVLAAEDDRFYTHPGVDYQGLLRAVVTLVKTGEKRQGGSTITMQVARNFFLTSKKTYTRKVREILLALKIEGALSKDAILELYLNKIYLGTRAYGVAAAAQVYYGTSLDQLTLAQSAMLAGLPKAPSRYNPLVNLARATERRNYILGRMRNLGYISEADYQTALAEPELARRHSPGIEAEAPYVAEMVRAELVSRYGEEVYGSGFRIYTTVDSHLQAAANAALRKTLLDYDRRHGYHKPARHVEVPTAAGPAEWAKLLGKPAPIGELVSGLVVGLAAQSASVYTQAGVIELPWSGISWARAYIDENRRGPKPKTAADVLAVGDVIALLPLPDGVWELAEIPQVQGALVSLVPATGAITTLVGGFYFYDSSFNRVTQAERQPGSSFKPFLYSAALQKGFTPASIINDAPVVISNANLGGDWRPENYGRSFNGPTTLSNALAHSRNLVSIRVLRSIGIDYTIDYATRFGFKRDRLPRGLSLALGSSINTPLEAAAAYAVFANGGYYQEPYFIQRIEDLDGKIILQAAPPELCRECLPATPAELSPEAQLLADLGKEEGQQLDVALTTASPAALPSAAPPGTIGATAKQIISPQNAYQMTTMMREVITSGTGHAAMQLGRKDLAGKTGTTNDQRDAWFSGYNRDVVAIAWVGFDSHNPLGEKETGGHAALPMWMEFMRVALRDVPEQPLEEPQGIYAANIDPLTGEAPTIAVADTSAEPVAEEAIGSNAPPGNSAALPEELF